MNEFSISVPETPKSKGRPRLGKRGRVYTPIATHEAEQRIAEIWRQAAGPKFDGPVEIEVDFYKNETTIIVRASTDIPLSGLRGDIDNYLKLVMDGLNGVAWDDDKQVVLVYAAKME
jgi:crossover junction endodeoxyribonuclease RusA